LIRRPSIDVPCSARTIAQPCVAWRWAMERDRIIRSPASADRPLNRSGQADRGARALEQPPSAAGPLAREVWVQPGMGRSPPPFPDQDRLVRVRRVQCLLTRSESAPIRLSILPAVRSIPASICRPVPGSGCQSQMVGGRFFRPLCLTRACPKS
jgi:hypothetical protein